MNKHDTSSFDLCLTFFSQSLLSTRYQHCSMSIQRDIEDRRSSSWVRCQGMDLPILFWPFCMRLSPHGDRDDVGVTAARSLPLHHHYNHRLQPRHHPVCWRGSRLLPLTGRLTGRWNPRTLTTLRGAIRGRRREEKKKPTSVESW
jgi:hypothetical protein